MSVINTNITALISQQNLSHSRSALQTSMERLSSGLRINSAKDDAAGLAIANRLSSQISGLMQAQRNANDGISISQTAEGAMDQISDNISRIRELSVQAANGTNSDSDLESIQNEIGQRLSEIDRISEETSFNGVKVLDSDQGINIQVGANDGEYITLNLNGMDAASLGLSGFSVENTLTTSDLEASARTETVSASLNIQDATFNDTNAAATFSVYTTDGNPDQLIVANDATNEGWIASYDNETGELVIDTDAAADVADVTAGGYTAAAGTVVVGQDAEGNDVIMDAADLTTRNDAASATPTLYLNETDNAYYVQVDGADYAVASIDFDPASATYGQVSYSSAAATDNTGDTMTLVTDAVVSSPEDAVTIDTSGLDTALVGDSAEVYAFSNGSGYVVKGSVDGSTVYYAAEVDDTSGAVTLGNQLTADPMATLDEALSQVDGLRSEMGAMQNRFESAIDNLATSSTNLSAARSRIEDADYAVEVSNMTRAQILQQAGTSVLAQANQIPQTVLSLLR